MSDGMRTQESLLESVQYPGTGTPAELFSPHESLLPSALGGNQIPPVLQVVYNLCTKFGHGGPSWRYRQENYWIYSTDPPSLYDSPLDQFREKNFTFYHSQTDFYEAVDHDDGDATYNYTGASTSEGDGLVPVSSGYPDHVGEPPTGTNRLEPVGTGTQWFPNGTAPAYGGESGSTYDNGAQFTWRYISREFQNDDTTIVSVLSSPHDFAGDYTFMYVQNEARDHPLDWPTCYRLSFDEYGNPFGPAHPGNDPADFTMDDVYTESDVLIAQAYTAGSAPPGCMSQVVGWHGWSIFANSIWLFRGRAKYTTPTVATYWIGRCREYFTSAEGAPFLPVQPGTQLQRVVELISPIGVLGMNQVLGDDIPIPFPDTSPFPLNDSGSEISTPLISDYYFAVVGIDPAAWSAWAETFGHSFGEHTVTYP